MLFRSPVYFHCAHGQDRTGTLCAIYRMEVDGWSNDESWGEMDHFGFNHVWEALERFVKGYKPKGTWRLPLAVEAAPVGSKS